MRIFRHSHDLPADCRGAVVALGNFDGVHRGHQALIAKARREAALRQVSLAAVVFEPYPQEFFQPAAEPFRLTPFRTKARLLAAHGVDILTVLHFDAAMAAMSAQDFVVEFLVKHMGAVHVVVGEDFRFGKGRKGDVAVLAYMGEMERFGVTIFPPVAGEGGPKISSSRIRAALKKGRPDEAARALGHWWSVEAHVAHGDKRGRTIGYPTANLRLEGILQPAFGVYAVRAAARGQAYDGVANFGIRPMFETPVPLLEVHLFGFDGDLYGELMQVEFVTYLRPERKFAGLDALKEQIAADAEEARAALRRAPSP